MPVYAAACLHHMRRRAIAVRTWRLVAVLGTESSPAVCKQAAHPPRGHGRLPALLLVPGAQAGG